MQNNHDRSACKSIFDLSTSGTIVPGIKSDSKGIKYEVEPDLAIIGQKLTVNILGERYDCEIVEDSPYDPKNITIRADA